MCIRDRYNASYLKKEGQKILDGNRSRVNALVFCDLDNLKFVNDNYGHEMGDHYLKAMADLLTDIAFGEQCMAVRLSGDEFVLFFYGYSERKTIAVSYTHLDVYKRQTSS